LARDIFEEQKKGLKEKEEPDIEEGGRIKILKGHTSSDTAYVVDDYPYGFKLRCKIRYWLEEKKGHGVRFISQTTNPRKLGQIVWNKPKASVYCDLAGAMFLNEDGHVKWEGLTTWADVDQAEMYLSLYKEGMSERSIRLTERFINAKKLYEEKKAAGMDWRQAAKEAFLETLKTLMEGE